MDWDEARAKSPSRQIAVGEDLSGLSMAELKGRIAALQDEIARIEAELDRKVRHEAAASALFKSK